MIEMLLKPATLRTVAFAGLVNVSLMSLTFTMQFSARSSAATFGSRGVIALSGFIGNLLVGPSAPDLEVF